MNIVMIVGSLRKQSFNLQLARIIEARHKEKFNMHYADIRALPHYDQDEENDPPQSVKDFKAAIAQADGVIIATPEFNWSIPGVLKNALDWASRVDKVFADKPVMILGASPGMLGTVRAQMHLREMLGSPGLQAKLQPPGGNEVLVNLVHQKFDEVTGQFQDEATLQFIDSKIDQFLEFIKAN